MKWYVFLPRSQLDRSFQQFERNDTENQDKEANCCCYSGTEREVGFALELWDRIKKCVDYAHKSFEYEEYIQSMQNFLEDDLCDDDSNIKNPNVLANITNTKDELQELFQKIKFCFVCLKWRSVRYWGELRYE